MRNAAILALACLLSGISLSQALPVAAYELSRGDDRNPSLIDPSITKNPIEVLVWLRNDITDEDARRVLTEIRQGLDLWERIPTCHLHFRVASIRSATRPAYDRSKLLVVAAYRRDFPPNSGGAPLPWGGYPGSWEAAVADNTFKDGWLSRVAAHEIGHALGFLHTTISNSFFAKADIPIMHWAHGNTLTQDDIAVASLAYPDPEHPLQAVTGILRGRCVDQQTGFPVNGVNVVAVEAESGKPVLARLTGTEHTPGGFELAGLPPGNYRLRALNGRSFRGFFVGMAQQYVQTDNFDAQTAGPYAVNAGDAVDVRDVQLPIEPVRVEAAATSRDALAYQERATTEPPAATVGAAYAAWLRLRGGIRPLQLVRQEGLPTGLEAEIVSMIQATGSDPNGEHFLVIGGTPAQPGRFPLSFVIEDLHHHRSTIQVVLTVTPR